jgi:hypothetical protein
LEATNKVRLILSTHSCGAAVGAAPFASITGFSATQVTNSAPYKVYGLGTATAGTPKGYTLCWSHSPGANVAKYSFEVGMFTLQGPKAQATDCTLTASCDLQLVWSTSGTASTNEVRVILSSASCGDNVLASLSGLTNPKQVTNTAPHKTYALSTATVGTAGAEKYSLCWSHDPSGYADYSYLVGASR